MRKKLLIRKYIPYWDWEDFKNGMWNTVVIDENKLLQLAIEFTGDCEKYGAAMLKVIFEWKQTMINSLTNTSINQKAFVGHCAVCFELGIPEYITRMAWKELTEKQRIDANKKADYAIKIWRKNYEEENFKLHPHLGTQMLLEWNT